MELDQYLQRCHAYPGATVRLVTFAEAFRRTLTGSQQRAWPKHRIRTELVRRGFPVGRGGQKVLLVGGLSLDPPGRFEVVAGRLRVVAAT